MKIVKQLSESEFIIELQDNTNREIGDHHVIVAHDYVKFMTTTTLSTDFHKMKEKVYGKHKFVDNCIWIPSEAQITIRAFSEVILPMLNGRDETKPEHYKNYDYHNSTVTFYNPDGVKMISIPVDGRYETLSYDLYKKLTNKD